MLLVLFMSLARRSTLLDNSYLVIILRMIPDQDLLSLSLGRIINNGRITS